MLTHLDFSRFSLCLDFINTILIKIDYIGDYWISRLLEFIILKPLESVDAYVIHKRENKKIQKRK